jgi:hypothetical protein
MIISLVSSHYDDDQDDTCVCARLTCVRVQVSLEPVLHQVSEAVAETLRPHTAAADFVSPDWDTALALSRLQAHMTAK